MTERETLFGVAADSRSNDWLAGESQNAEGGERETRWLTPPHIVQALGRFDLDPCGAPGHTLADRTYLLENGENGLVEPWVGRVWLNPPYGPNAHRFLAKLAAHGDGIALIFARTETRTFHETVWAKARGVLFMRGRIAFLDASGKPGRSNAGAPSCLVAYGDANLDALALCGLPGFVVSLGGAR